MQSLNGLSKPNKPLHPDYELQVDNFSIPFSFGKILLIGSRPGMGRSILMLYFFNQLFEKYKEPICFISNEEDEPSIFKKFISTVIQVGYRQLNKLSSEVRSSYPILTNEKCFFHYSTEPWEVLKLQLEETLSNDKVRFLFIDKVQGLYCEQNFLNRDHEMSFIMRELKAMAHIHQVCLIVSSSLNRSVESRGAKQPKLSDLRDSGTLEDVADMVLLLNRYEYYDITEDEEGNSLRGIADLKIVKSRMCNGANIRLLFDKEVPCFKPYSLIERFSSNKELQKLVNVFDLSEKPEKSDDDPF